MLANRSGGLSLGDPLPQFSIDSKHLEDARPTRVPGTVAGGKLSMAGKGGRENSCLVQCNRGTRAMISRVRTRVGVRVWSTPPRDRATWTGLHSTALFAPSAIGPSPFCLAMKREAEVNKRRNPASSRNRVLRWANRAEGRPARSSGELSPRVFGVRMRGFDPSERRQPAPLPAPAHAPSGVRLDAAVESLRLLRGAKGSGVAWKFLTLPHLTGRWGRAARRVVWIL